MKKNKKCYFQRIGMATIKVLLFSSLLCSCENFIEIEPPKNSVVPAAVFKSNDLATSVMLGIYQQMALNSYASGDVGSISRICGTTADEFVGYNTLLPTYHNQLSPTDSPTNTVWEKIYQRIYDVNALLEGLDTNEGRLLKVNNQLKGEALFIRAFNYFYLVNLFGAVPLYTSSDYTLNMKSKKSSESEVYDQILRDLTLSEQLLGVNYISTERIRPNKYAVYSLMARLFLYKSDWSNAFKYANIVISSPEYSIVNLDDVFVKNSKETIWQLQPPANSNTNEGRDLILTGVPTEASLREDFAEHGFEGNDNRRTSWVKNILIGGQNYYYPFKYKIKSSTTISEYSMVLRLAELYLIRAEATANLGNIADAIRDVDIIRNRANLPLIASTNPNISQGQLLSVIQNERKIELFSEWGHRWFDLKRLGKSTEILGPIKSNWKPYHILFPIPFIEINKNSNISQNAGY